MENRNNETEIWSPETETWTTVKLTWLQAAALKYRHSKTVSGARYELFQDSVGNWYRYLIGR